MKRSPDQVFDMDGERYSGEVGQAISLAGQEHRFFIETKALHLLDICTRLLGPTERLSALDLGCGVGLTETFLTPRFRRVAGVDVSETAVASARAANPGGQLVVYDGKRLPFADGEFDVTFAICVLHHVPPAAWPEFLSEMKRVTRPGGLCVVFEHNPLNPATRFVVARCPFDEDAVLLGGRAIRKLFTGAALTPVEARYILFFPFRFAGSGAITRLLSWLPMGAQHYAVARKGQGA